MINLPVIINKFYPFECKNTIKIALKDKMLALKLKNGNKYY
jgi:hypothetical protein